MNNIDMLILFLITFCASTFFTYYVKRILIKARIADNPIVSEHRHKSGTPTMGGIAFLFTLSFISFIMCGITCTVFHRYSHFLSLLITDR